MSSVHRQPNRPHWFCAFTDADGRRVFRSTKTGNKKQAQQICAAWEKTARTARKGALSPEKARAILEEGIADIMEAAGMAPTRHTVKSYLDEWQKLRESVTKASTALRYDAVLRDFLEFMGADSKRSITSLTTETIEEYRSRLADRVSPATVNTHLKVLRVALKKAVPRYFASNPAANVENLDNSGRNKRRPFTLAELKKLLEIATEEWRTMILAGLYTGLRLGDCASLCWNNVDLARSEITITTEKTGRTQVLPIAKALRRHIETLPAGDSPTAPLCPSLHDKGSAWLSGQFYGIMTAAGLVSARKDHQSKGKGRTARRTLSPIGFHSLRHTATSLLKNAGVSDAIARDIIGHESALVSKNYTHIDSDTKRAAVDKMPDITR